MRLFSILLLLSVGSLSSETLRDYPVQPVPFTAVRVEDAFWTPRLETNRLRTVWYDYQKCEETGRIDNFKKAAKQLEGPHKGDPFDDSDVYKVVEGAAYCLALHPDPKLEEYTDKLIATIAAAQEPDGYLYTARTINPANAPGRASKVRWLNERGALGNGDSHELYNVGHMYEAAVAYFQATGKRQFLDVAIKNANLVAATFGPNPGQLKIPSGHQEIEIGLVKLYRATGDKNYLDLSRFLLECRGRNFEDPQAKRQPNPYYSDHIPVTEQSEAVGHAVRSAYMYTAMADIAALTGDQAYLKAIDRLWDNVVGRKLHLTGGIGASPDGEAFGNDYELPNQSAYLETCAAIANAMWNYRMFLLHGDARYIDVLERIIYNGFLSGVGMTGDCFFYPNPLEADGKQKFNHGSNQRAPWFGCSCCPVNDVRFIPSIAGFIYAVQKEEVFVNLFIGGSATMDVGGQPVRITQRTGYPWKGDVTLEVAPGKLADTAGKRFALNVRLPGWALSKPVPSNLYRYDAPSKPSIKLRINGRNEKLKVVKGYARLERHWKVGDKVELDLEMPVRRVLANDQVKADMNRFALERGPLVYCAEGADNASGVLDEIFPGKTRFKVRHQPNLLGGVTTLEVQGAASGAAITCIPYYAWCNRGPNAMRVWFPTVREEKLASHCWSQDSVEACFDGKIPARSNDANIPRFTWWDHRGGTEWVLRKFDQPTKVSACAVYWFDDSGVGSCRIPKAWRLSYLAGGQWKPIHLPELPGAKRDQFNRVSFPPVTVDALRLEADLQQDFSGGILEWQCQ
jgi:DUF1680 family protein